MFLFACVFTNSGCQPDSSSQSPTLKNEDGPIESIPCIRYAPAKIDIAPLTKFVPADSTHRPRINLYVSLLDQFGSQIKSPGRFRFELYEHVQRSADSKGKRLAMWPKLDLLDLTDPSTNNEYWRDFLRSYEFTLPLDDVVDNNRILEVTFFCPTGKRISSEFEMK